MKINKNEFKVKFNDYKPVDYHIQKVIQPFIPMIQSRELSVYIAWKTHKAKMVIEADWQKYQLILFNMVQNAVKYNN